MPAEPTQPVTPFQRVVNTFRIAAERLAHNEALERAEYERLRAKFEGGGAR